MTAVKLVCSKMLVTITSVVKLCLVRMSMASSAIGGSFVHFLQPGLNLRMQHFHCFSEHGDGGHFHYDVMPAEAEYVGYFNIPEYMFRVDNYPSEG